MYDKVKTKTVGRCPTPRELFVKSSIKNFKGMHVVHSGKWTIRVDDFVKGLEAVFSSADASFAKSNTASKIST